MFRSTWVFLFSLLVLTAVGCGQNPYEINSVTGTVTMDGAPLASARVTFFPTEGRPSYGITDEDGRYKLAYIRDIMGAEAGQHHVTITTEADTLPNGQTPPERIPRRYNAASTLTAEVMEGANEINFDLESK